MTSTYLREIEHIVKAEMLLNPSWFGSGGRVVTIAEGGSSYWDELQRCAPQIRDVFFTNAV